MATKRSVSTASGVSSAAAPARVKNTVARKPKNSAAAENTESMSALSSIPITSTTTAPTYDDIAQLAYSFWEARGYQGGSPEEDWLRAEEALSSSLAAAAAN